MPFPRLNIRQKVALGVASSLMALCVFGGFAAFNLKLMERKVRLVEVCDDFKSDILEARRYEKNFLLYGHVDDLRQSAEYLKQTTVALDQAEALASWEQSRTQLKELRDGLHNYATLLEAVPSSDAADTPAGQRTVAQLRTLGKKLVDDSQHLAATERQRILVIIQELNANLIASLMALVVLGAGMLLGTRRYIVQPLRIIEKTTESIARGEFQSVAVPPTADEVESVMRAFNHMVEELERRQEHLVQAQKMASIGTLTSGIAHQLNNPLNNIATSCHLLTDEITGQGNELVNRMLNNIHQEVFRARDIVKGLLEFSRHRDFHQALHPLREMAERAVSLASSQIPPGIKMVVDIPANLMAFMDPQRIQEALINMLLNSAQAINEPTGSISVNAHPAAREGFVALAVEDTGSGIPRDKLEQVFDPFFSTKEVGKGTGLGLYVVYGIVQKHGGSVHIESHEGQGTIITIELPVASTGDMEGGA